MPFAHRGSVRLFYTDSGAGDPPLLFVHGWCCDSTNWRRQVPVFRRRHRVVAVDLRGHGRSSKPEQDYAMDTFADDLEWLMGELGLERPVVIGHSMGGIVALRLAGRRKRDIAALVMVDAPLFIAISQPEVEAILQGIDGLAYLQAAQQLIDSRFFRPTTPKDLGQELTERMLTTPQHVMSSALRHLAAEMRPDPTEFAIPSLFVDAGRTCDELAFIERALPGVEIGRTVGAGHFNMLETPDQVNAMLRTFLGRIEGRST